MKVPTVKNLRFLPKKGKEAGKAFKKGSVKYFPEYFSSSFIGLDNIHKRASAY